MHARKEGKFRGEKKSEVNELNTADANDKVLI